MEKIIWNIIKEIIKQKYNLDIREIKLSLPPPKESADFAFWAFIIAKELKSNPMQIAMELASFLGEREEIEEANSSGPYVNIKLSKDIFSLAFLDIYKKWLENLFEKNNEYITVDYIWANVWKPLHIGHMCTPNIGQAICNLYRKLWYNVIGDSHIWDWGIIFGKLILAYKMWGEKDRLEKDAVNYLFELYVKVSSYIEDNWEKAEEEAREEFKLLSLWNKESIEYWREFTSFSIENLSKELARLNVKSDFDIGESFYEWIWLPKLQDYPDLKWSMNDIVEELLEKWIAKKNEDNSVGVIFPEETKIPSVMLQKRDGTKWYLASDLACIKYRKDNWNPRKMIYSIDVRQQLHLKQAFEISKMAWWVDENNEFHHAYNGFISLKDWAMSTRKWRIIRLEDLLEEAHNKARDIILEKRQDIKKEELEELSEIIWIGAIKYWYLKKSRETDIIFDWDEFMTFEWNSGPYIQYSYVRAIRILENYLGDFNIDTKAIFKTDEETNLVKQLLDYKNILEETASKDMPHLLCQYIYNLTKIFSTFYSNIHILNEENEDKKILRLKLVDMFAKTLKDSFSILGIEMPSKM